MFECGLRVPTNTQTVSSQRHSDTGVSLCSSKPRGCRVRTMSRQRALSWVTSAPLEDSLSKSFPGLCTSLPGERAYKTKVLRCCLWWYRVRRLWGSVEKLAWGRSPVSLPFWVSGHWGAFLLPSQTELALGQPILLSEPAFSPQTMQAPVGYPGNYVSISVCLTITCCPCHGAGWVARVGLSGAGSATLPLIPALIDCFPMIDVYPCTPFSESERGR